MRIFIFNSEEAFGIPEGQIYTTDCDAIPRLNEQFVLRKSDNVDDDLIAFVRNVRWVHNLRYKTFCCELDVTFPDRGENA